MRSIGFGIWLAIALVGAIGVFPLALGLRNVYRAIASRSWPVTNGIVTESSTTTSVSRDRQRTTTMYGARTIVRYHVGDKDYSTSTRHFGQFEGSGDQSESVLERYRFPVGRTVRVSYSAGDPSVATVNPGLRLSALMLPLAGIVFLGFAYLIYIIVSGNGASTLFVNVFGYACVLIGVSLLTPGVTNLWRGWQSTSWPTTTAFIVYGTPGSDPPDSASVDASNDTTNATKSVSVPDTLEDPLETSNAPQRLVYRYEVGGQRHYNNVRRYGQLAGSSDTEWSSAIAARYPLGHNATVSVSPSDPDLAVLEPGIAREALFLPGAGVAFLLFGVMVMRVMAPAMPK